MKMNEGTVCEIMPNLYYRYKNIEDKTVTYKELDGDTISCLHEYFVHELHICDDLPIDINLKLSHLKETVPMIEEAMKGNSFHTIWWHISPRFTLADAHDEAKTLISYISELAKTYPDDTVFIYTVVNYLED